MPPDPDSEDRSSFWVLVCVFGGFFAGLVLLLVILATGL